MDFVVLIVLVCSLAHPSAPCRERHLVFQSSGSLAACMWQAQPYLARWSEEHPDARIARYRCAWPNSEDQPT